MNRAGAYVKNYIVAIVNVLMNHFFISSFLILQYHANNPHPQKESRGFFMLFLICPDSHSLDYQLCKMSYKLIGKMFDIHRNRRALSFP